jgi:hypothetical protein
MSVGLSPSLRQAAWGPRENVRRLPPGSPTSTHSRQAPEGRRRPSQTGMGLLMPNQA